jgi:hypothetical protein
MGWFARQYDDIKGHFKWALLGPLWAAISWAGSRLLHMIPNMPDWAVWAIVLLASSILFVLVARHFGRAQRPTSSAAQNATNTLMTSPTGFDAAAYFKNSYFSQLQQELENNVRAAATQNQPNDREGFYVKLIATGLPSFIYEIAWAYIYKSQLLLLQELNRRVLLLPQVKIHYDKAVSDNPAYYAHYSFEQWLDFMKSHVLLIQHPNEMVEITVRGRDFLKYLVHWGRSADDRKL